MNGLRENKRLSKKVRKTGEKKKQQTYKKK